MNQAFLSFFFRVFVQIILGWLATSICFAEDTSRIKRYKKHIAFAVNVTQFNMDANLLNEQSKKSIHYRTAAATRLGASFDYRWLGVEVFTQLPIGKSQVKEKGQTNTNGVFISLNRSRYCANITYQNFKGFYWSNPDETATLLSKQGYPKRPDISNRLVNFSGYYIFSPNRFSTMGAHGKNERQHKSGGSFFAGIGFSSNKIKGDTVLVPTSQRENFEGSRQIQGVNCWLYHLSGGYAYTFVFKRQWFASLYLIPGIAYFSATEVDIYGNKKAGKGRGSIRFENRVSIGYNSDKYFAGVWYAAFQNNQRLGPATSFSYGLQSFRVYVGRRFQMKKQLGYLGL